MAAGAFVFVFFTAWFLLVFGNLIGANTVSTACTANCSAVSGDETPLRGGAGLSGRQYLWAASADAIKHRPVLGYGPGNDVPAIDHYLGSSAKQARHNPVALSCHSAFVRTVRE